MSLSKLLRTAVFAVLAGGCTPRAKPLTAAHPANPDAEPGRLVGPPAALDAAPPAPPETAAPTHEGDH